MATDLFQLFETDPTIESEGIWLDYGVNAKKQPIRIRVARAGDTNEHYRKRLEALLKKHRRSIQNETIEPEVLDDVFRRVYAETVVKEWVGVTDKQGDDIPFSVANVITLFEMLPGLFKDVQEQASKAALFRVAVLEEDAKN